MRKLERQSNFELMRLISMFFIVGWHVIMRGGIFKTGSELSGMISNIIMGIMIVHVNSLFFITGYFNGDKDHVSTKKAFKLIGMIWFYRVAFLALFLYLGILPISNILIGEELFPLDLNNYWFMSTYLIIYMVSPYLNKIIKNMEEKEYFNFITILFIILSVLPAISNLKAVNNDGFNIIQFSLVYFIGGYFKKFPLKNNYHFKKLSEKKLRYLLIFLFFFVFFIRLSIYYFGDKLLSFKAEEIKYIGTIITNSYFRYSSPLVIIQSCIYCLIFETFDFKSKIINLSAKLTLGIYLVHENIFVREKLYDFLRISSNHSLLGSIAWFIIYTLIIYLGSFTIELIRKLLLLLFGKVRSYFTTTKNNNSEKIAF